MSLPKSFPLKLAGGETAEIPSVGFGTWAFEGGPTDPANPEWIKKAMNVAFDAGYRHLECAWFYGVSLKQITFCYTCEVSSYIILTLHQGRP